MVWVLKMVWPVAGDVKNGVATGVDCKCGGMGVLRVVWVLVKMRVQR